MDLKYFMGNGLIIDVTHKKGKKKSLWKKSRNMNNKLRQWILSCLKRIGIKKPGTDEFYDHPFLSKAGGEYLLLQKSVKTAGIDAD